jgi:hypothetical protein
MGRFSPIDFYTRFLILVGGEDDEFSQRMAVYPL